MVLLRLLAAAASVSWAASQRLGVSAQFLEACLVAEAQADCELPGAGYITWPAQSWGECRSFCCRDPTCSAWMHRADNGRSYCSLTNRASSSSNVSRGSTCGVARQSLPASSPSPLPAQCGGIAYVDFQRTRGGAPFVRLDASSFLECQAHCCSDAKCRGWVFSPGAASEPPCALIEAPGADYPAASVISGAFLKPFPSPSPSPYSEPSASFESAFFLVTFVLCGGFVFAVWHLRRDGTPRAAQPSVFSTVLAVLKRRQSGEVEERTRLSTAAGVVVERADSRGPGAAAAHGGGASTPGPGQAGGSGRPPHRGSTAGFSPN